MSRHLLVWNTPGALSREPTTAVIVPVEEMLSCKMGKDSRGKAWCRFLIFPHCLGCRLLFQQLVLVGACASEQFWDGFFFLRWFAQTTFWLHVFFGTAQFSASTGTFVDVVGDGGPPSAPLRLSARMQLRHAPWKCWSHSWFPQGDGAFAMEDVTEVAGSRMCIHQKPSRIQVH